MGKHPGAGRPAAAIDWRTVDALLQAGCSGVQVSSRLGIHPNTLYERCSQEHNCDFSEYSRLKREHGETLLLQKQFDAAMKGDRTMLIWLGKQRLGQKERSANETEATVKVLTTEVLVRTSGVPLATDEKDAG
jgi:hypothetical protein